MGAGATKTKENFNQSVTKNPIVFVVGANGHGELGLKFDKDVHKLTSWSRCNENIQVATINNGSKEAIIVAKDDKIYYCGVGRNGKFGDGISRVVEDTYFGENNIKIKQIFTALHSSHTIGKILMVIYMLLDMIYIINWVSQIKKNL